MTLDELLEQGPFTYDDDTIDVRNANGNALFGDINYTEMLSVALNRIHEMRGEMDALKADNERIKDDVEAGYRDIERHYTEFVSDNLRLRSENERLSDDIERWRRKRDDAVRTRDTLAQENSNLLDGASKVGAENAALKARVAELEEERNYYRDNNQDISHQLEEAQRQNNVLWTQRRFEAACAIAPALWTTQDDDRNGYYKSKESFAEDVRDYADAIVAALDKPKEPETPPEPPAAEVWRIDESRTIENEQWYEINKGERAANIEGLEREEVERIVAALNGGER